MEEKNKNTEKVFITFSETDSDIKIQININKETGEFILETDPPVDKETDLGTIGYLAESFIRSLITEE